MGVKIIGRCLNSSLLEEFFKIRITITFSVRTDLSFWRILSFDAKEVDTFGSFIQN